MRTKAGEFLLYGSIFISCCTVALALETAVLLNISLHSAGFYGFLFGATLVQYNLHYMSKKTAVAGSTRLIWTLQHPRLHRYLLFFGILLLLLSLTVFHPNHFYILLALGAIATLYSFPVLPFVRKKRLKDYGLLKIITISLLWTLVTVWLPASNKGYDPTTYWLVFFQRFVFMFVLCLLFDVRDASIDAVSGIRTLPVRLGNERSYWIAFLSLGLFVLLSCIQFVYDRQLRLLLPMLLSALATGYVIHRTRRNQSDNMFLAGIDGMMILQAVLVYLFAYIP